MKLLEPMMFTKVLMIIVAIWFAPMIYGQEAEAPATADVADAPATDSFKNGGWYEDARATYYGDIHGEETRRKFLVINYYFLLRILFKILITIKAKPIIFINDYITHFFHDIMFNRGSLWIY